MKQNFRLFQWGLLILDTIVIWTAFLLYGHVSPHTFSDYIVMMGCYTAIGLSLYSFKGYVLSHKSISQSLIACIQGLVLAGLISSFLVLVFDKSLPKGNMLIYFASISVCILLLRVLFFYLVVQKFPVQKIIIVGSEKKWKDIAYEMSASVLHKIKPIAFLKPDLNALDMCLAKHPKVQSVLIIENAFLGLPNIRKRTNQLRQKNIRVEYFPEIAENYLEKVPLEVAKEFPNYYEIALNTAPIRYSKRAVDVFLSILGLIIGFPFMVVISIWILLEDGFPVIFRQERVGMNGEKFVMHKFRSMRNVKQRDKSPAFVTQEQARVLNPIGKIIRKTRLDELPQLWDILMGNMSLIGPRPEQPKFVEQFSDELPFYDYRHHVRPGITGWAQVNFRYAATLEETAKKLEYDLYYVKNWSMLLDLSIILKTVETMLGMRGSK
jgi:exopolysaccharide biosynthesis polyprenyl glycosylphosphotransferase